mmetsp:Transcript_26937/g.84509  ORF Transcript_26937/g.84509 Transcript_26937/m.84509 type:complete len:431 (-) Transcript_26937:157-1449(-)|eukprot:CAMPEP_0118857462 /NCGR_PEP_ID=MMETSP1163-20130328/4553_1 /TAXON_ID=124430 /ORGANISM="Phaeomonas parva, Strain CCMP2877" /LENGTH=430 /DNA_ID=CAMNT_0006790775 /DNA_START=537 /DNA_END=1829 /DNA_ORIENTATION=-
MLYKSALVALGLAASASAFRAPQRAGVRRAGASRLAAVTTAPETATTYNSDAELPECPLTEWGTRNIDFTSELAGAKKSMPLKVECPKNIAGDADAEISFLASKRKELKADVLAAGAVLLRGFTVTQEPAGFMRAHAALGMELCLDPLHSVAARDKVPGELGISNGDGNVAKKGGGSGTTLPGLYQAVNKQSRSKYFVGMHNEMVGNRANRYAAFVCFKPAEEGGEFLLLDTREMAKELPKDVLAEMDERQIRFVTAELPVGFLDSLGPVGEAIKGPAKSLLDVALKMKVDFDVDSLFEKDDEGNTVFRVIAEPQPPVIRNPETGEPVWFCNIHSHSKYLRDQREMRDGKLGATTGASKFNKTDVRFGDLSGLDEKVLKAVDAATMKLVNRVKMQRGDVVLLDNYSCMHGRDIFDGTRMHGVSWFKSWEA